jgi:hypothetical protein
MKLYLLNALVTPFKPENEDDVGVFMVKKISLQDYSSILRQAIDQKMEIVPAIGHRGTVEFLCSILDDDLKSYVKYNRDRVFLDEGDIGLVFRLESRGDSLRELDFGQIKAAHEKDAVEWLLLSRVYAPETIMDPSSFFAKGE